MYLPLAPVLMSARRAGPTSPKVNPCEMLAAHVRTFKPWRIWWTGLFPTMPPSARLWDTCLSAFGSLREAREMTSFMAPDRMRISMYRWPINSLKMVPSSYLITFTCQLAELILPDA